MELRTYYFFSFGTDLFEVTLDGQILLSRDLKLEDIDTGYSVNLTVRVEDKAVEPLSDTAYVLIAITLPYTIPPMFTNSSCENQTVSIDEVCPCYYPRKVQMFLL